MFSKRLAMMFVIGTSTSLLGCAGEDLPEEAFAESEVDEDVDQVELELEPFLLPPPGDDDDPEPNDPIVLPPAPGFTKPLSRTTGSITIEYGTSTRATSASLRRRLGTGTTWTTVKSNALNAGFFTDSGLAQDTIYCYRIVASNDGGATKNGIEKCALTAKRGSPGVYRAQLRLRMADVEDAGGDDKLGVNLNTNALGYNHTGINYAHDDFERNSDFTYDLNLNSIGKLHDISNIKITKYGSDALCIRSFSLLVNGVDVFTRNYGNTSATCHWMDSDDGHSNTLNVTHAELRAASSFANFQPPFPSLSVPKAEMISRIESLMGDLIWNSGEVKWGKIYNNSGVETWRGNASNKLHVDLDLEGTINNFPNPEVDVDFDMVINFENQGGSAWALKIDVQNIVVAVDFSWWVEVIGAIGAPICGIASGTDCVSLLENYIEDKAEAGFSSQSQRIPLGQLPCPAPSVTVSEQGALSFGCF